MKFRKKPVIIDAMQIPEKWDGEGLPLTQSELWVWLGTGGPWELSHDGGIDIQTLEGRMHARPGDWIIRGIKSELYPCKPDIFEATYEAV